ncbi:MAG: DUF1080 domain-containing protein, partial [Bacteroidetes bacterium]
MKRQLPFILIALLIIINSCNTCQSKTPDPKQPMGIYELTTEEVSEGWILLFDGKTTNGWRNFKEEKVNEGWQATDGNLIALGIGGDLGGDIISVDQFEDFELSLEWAISPGGNSGIFFHVLESNYPTVYATGPEYQILDDVGYKGPLEEWQKTGANYAMHNATNKMLKPVGEFNTSRIKVLDAHVEHWLNGKKILEYELWSDHWKKRLQKGKWKDMPGYGLAKSGHIALQDHGSVV